MALRHLQITPAVAMRARDVSRPTRRHEEEADRRPLRDEVSRRSGRGSGEPRPGRAADRRPGGTGGAAQGSGGSSPVDS
ncbi:hypothetical protein TBS_35970 [Thermobispora bispora]|uniref:hypothetical protein n=1 Tax=Thermobispora bispora TaxID=2006 RepID=UPI0030E7AE5D